MPPIVPATDGIDPNALRVLVTGCGPWGRYAENPSWLAVKSLHNTILYKDPPAELLPSDQAAIITDEMEEFLRRPQQIHVTALEVPVNYQAVLSTVPGLHGRPPVLPRPNDPSFAVPPPPANGYDFIFHVGVAGRGPLRIERIGHKNGYRMKDGDGEYAPIVHLPKDTIGNDAEAELARMERMLASGSPDVPGLPMAPGGAEVVDIPPAPNRGFGKGYETFPDELSTEIDVPKLIVHLKENGIDQVYSSMDAGHYLCDFIFYCSLAEARRQVAPQEKFKERNTPIKSTPVLFMHCPPADQPLSTEQVTDAIQRVILWVCGRFHQP